MAHYYDDLADADRLQKKLYAEFRTRLVDEMLMKVDRMTMAHSLEARVPLLDHEVVEWAFQQPSEMKLRMTEQGPVSKYILKKVMEKRLPAEIVYRRKQGFDIPVGDWLDGGLVDLIREKVMGGNLRRLGLVDGSGLERLIRWHTDGHHHCASVLMLLLAFESWIDAYQSRVGQVMVA